MAHRQNRRFATSIALGVSVLITGAVPGAHAGGDQFRPDANAPRAAIADKYKWDLGPLFENPKAFEEALLGVAEGTKRLQAFAGKLANPKSLHECLEIYFATRLLANKATLYASMRLDTELRSTEFRGRSERALAAYKGFMTSAGFLRQTLVRMEQPEFTRLFQGNRDLRPYRSYVEGLRRRKGRLLTPEAEQVLAIGGDNLWAEIDINELPSDFERVFQAVLSELQLPEVVDEKGKKVQLTLSNYSKFRGSKNRNVRKQAVDGLFGTLAQHQNTLAAALAGQFRYSVYLAKARGYDSALDAYLDKENIDPAVYRNLVTTLKANAQPLHSYVEMRKQLLGLDKIYIYDLYVPIVAPGEVHYSYDEARKILPQALAPLGKDYVDVLAHGLDPENGWIDLYPHRDKRSGAFSASVYGIHPYVKMNYFADLDDLSTLAHEYGHALHSHLSMTNQPIGTFNYSPMLAEIASTANEKLLSDYLLNKTDNPVEQLFVLNNLVESIRTTIFRQALFAEFELAGHTAAEQGIPLTAEFFNRTYTGLLREYYGPGLEIDDHDALEWAYIPHFYYKYYVYSYAVGLSTGIAFADRLASGAGNARETYLNVLRAGSSVPPVMLLKDAGVDLTKPDVMKRAADLMGESLRKMIALLPKVKGTSPNLVRDLQVNPEELKALLKPSDDQDQKAAARDQ